MTWIKVTELPSNDRWVMVSIDGATSVIPYSYHNGRWWWYLNGSMRNKDNITHWRDYPDGAPIPKLKWQSRTKSDTEWNDISDEVYEYAQHLARYEFRQVEV